MIELPVCLEARERLTRHLGIEHLELVKTEYRVWNNSSLGCPEPGLCYLQVLTPGYEIIYQYEDLLFTIHTNLDGSHIMLDGTPPVHLTQQR